MNYLHAILLGLFQGALEFLPISSSAHLFLLEKWLNIGSCDKSVDASVQIGSGLAIMLYYYLYQKKALQELFLNTPIFQILIMLFLATMPAALCGLLFYSFIRSYLSSTSLIAYSLILGGILFCIAEKRLASRTMSTSTPPIQKRKSFLIGLFQILALIPGVSRSGSTIMGAEFLGISRKNAVLFSFFIAIPILLGAGSFDLFKNLPKTSNLLLPLLSGLSSFFATFFLAHPFFSLLIRYGLVPFAYYRITFGLLLIAIM